jgi:hypothetical protein
MKVSQKKSIDPIKLHSPVNLTAASLLKQQLFCYAASVTVYAWFMCWIAYDFFVWHKPLTQGNIVNYIGVAASIALIWIEAKFFQTQRLKQKIVTTQPPEPKKERQKRKQTKQQTDNPLNTQRAEPVSKLEEMQIQPTFLKCKHFVNQQDHNQIPDECLTCTNLLQCCTNRKQTT